MRYTTAVLALVTVLLAAGHGRAEPSPYPAVVDGVARPRAVGGKLVEVRVTAELGEGMAELAIVHEPPQPQGTPPALLYGPMVVASVQAYVAARFGAAGEGPTPFALHVDGVRGTCDVSLFKARCRIELRARYTVAKLGRAVVDAKVVGDSGELTVSALMSGEKREDIAEERFRRRVFAMRAGLKVAMGDALRNLDRELVARKDALTADPAALVSQLRAAVERRLGNDLNQAAALRSTRAADLARRLLPIHTTQVALPEPSAVFGQLADGGCGLLPGGPCARDLVAAGAMAQGDPERWVAETIGRFIAGLGETDRGWATTAAPYSILVGDREGAMLLSMPGGFTRELSSGPVAALDGGDGSGVVTIVQTSGEVFQVSLESGQRTELGKLPFPTEAWTGATVAGVPGGALVSAAPALGSRDEASVHRFGTVTDWKQLQARVTAKLEDQACRGAKPGTCWQGSFPGRWVLVGTPLAADASKEVRPDVVPGYRVLIQGSSTAGGALAKRADAAFASGDFARGWWLAGLDRVAGGSAFAQQLFDDVVTQSQSFIQRNKRSHATLERDYAENRARAKAAGVEKARAKAPELVKAMLATLGRRMTTKTVEVFLAQRKAMAAIVDAVGDAEWANTTFAPVETKCRDVIAPWLASTRKWLKAGKPEAAERELRRATAMGCMGEDETDQLHSEIVGLVESQHAEEEERAERQQQDKLVRSFEQNVVKCERAVESHRRALQAERDAGRKADMRAAERAKAARERAARNYYDAKAVVTRTIAIFRERGLGQAANGAAERARSCIYAR